jgi:hypothetical protein
MQRSHCRSMPLHMLVSAPATASQHAQDGPHLRRRVLCCPRAALLCIPCCRVIQQLPHCLIGRHERSGHPAACAWAWAWRGMAQQRGRVCDGVAQDSQRALALHTPHNPPHTATRARAHAAPQAPRPTPSARRHTSTRLRRAGAGPGWTQTLAAPLGCSRPKRTRAARHRRPAWRGRGPRRPAAAAAQRRRCRTTPVAVDVCVCVCVKKGVSVCVRWRDGRNSVGAAAGAAAAAAAGVHQDTRVALTCLVQSHSFQDLCQPTLF